MGRHFDEIGVPRIAGRMFGALMYHEQPASLYALAEELQVSKGSISSNARMLEGWGVIDRVTKPGDRRDYYLIAGNVQVRMLEREISRIGRMLEWLQKGVVAAPPTSEVVHDRFTEMIAYHERELDGVRVHPRRPDAA